MEFRPIREVLTEANSEAFHLETRDVYGVPSEDEPFQKFLRSEPFDYREWYADWSGFVASSAARGVSFKRVRVLTVPHSDYQRWSLEMAAFNVESGENIRYLPRHLAGAVPKDDYWLIDDRLVVFNLTDRAGRAVGGAATTDDPDVVSRCRDIRDRLWSLATPYARYKQVTGTR
ncbi:DUF6879 family protein [Nocardia takedensis]